MKKTISVPLKYSRAILNSLIQRFKSFMKGLLYCASEFESLIVRPSGQPIARRLFLQLSGVKFGRHCFFGNGFHLYISDFSLVLGERTCFGEKCGIYVHGDITIGDDFLAAPGLTINNGCHDLETLEPSSFPVEIGSRVWCGVNVTILAGAKIGDDCIIGANSLVRSEIPAASVAVGTPAKVIKTNIRRSKTVWSCYAKSESETDA